MNRKKYSVIIILYTVVNIMALVSFNINNNKLNYKEVNKVVAEGNEKNESYSKDNTMDTQKDCIDTNVSKNLAKDNKTKDSRVLDEDLVKKEIKANREREAQLNEIYKSDSEIVKVNEIEFDKYNKQVIEKNKVMKVPAEELMNKLTISEKAKIMSICKELNEEDYSEINEFLNYKNERLAVLRTLNVIENKVDAEQVEKLKEIFSKYIDMDKVEGN